MASSKTLLITGGTGSFGHSVLERYLKRADINICIFSRDEKKQYDMFRMISDNYGDYAKKVEFILGDVRDISSLRRAMHGIDYVFHAAALKQVTACERYPFEAVMTNVVGTLNVLDAACAAGVKKVVCLSSDKAVYPISAMGETKALMEKLAVAKSRNDDRNGTDICCTRYGNVMCSRASVIPLFISQIKSGHPITVTNPNMTRFIMSFDEAVDLVEYAMDNALNGDIMIYKAPACTVGDLAKAVCELFGKSTNIVDIGARSGEKMYETLLTADEFENAMDLGRFYRIPAEPQPSTALGTELNSNNASRLSVDEIKQKLLELEYIQSELDNQ